MNLKTTIWISTHQCQEINRLCKNGFRLTISDKIFSTSNSAEVLLDFLRIESEYLARSSADLFALDSHTAFLRLTIEQVKVFWYLRIYKVGCCSIKWCCKSRIVIKCLCNKSVIFTMNVKNCIDIRLWIGCCWIFNFSDSFFTLDRDIKLGQIWPALELGL